MLRSESTVINFHQCTPL